MKHPVLLTILILLTTPALAQRAEPSPESTSERTGRRGDRTSTTGPSTAPTADKVDETPIVTHHEIKLGDDKTLKYTATVAQMPLKTNTGETEAHIFYMAYTLDVP